MTVTQNESPHAAAGQITDEDLALLLLIRHFETAVLDLFGRGELHGTTHTCLGQEYIPVALAPLLTPEDYVLSNHRGHGHYLARFADPVGLLAEIMGREGAVCSGVGGSQHIHRDRYLSTGVQGESLPVAAGIALHLKQREPGRIAVVHIGDGTWGEGAVYEALNLASLWALPLLIVVEDNAIAQSTPSAAHTAGTIAGRAAAFAVDYWFTASSDLADVRATLGPCIEDLRRTPRPLIAHFATRRLGPHSKGDDTRSAEELERLHAEDWGPRLAAAEPERFAQMDQAQRAVIEAAVHEVRGRGPSVWHR